MSEEFDRTPADILKKLEDVRNKILWIIDRIFVLIYIYISIFNVAPSFIYTLLIVLQTLFSINI